MKIAYEAVISQSPLVVFPWIAEPEKAMQWQKNVKRGEILIEQPDVIGTTFTEIIEENGNQLEMTGTITEYVENELIAFHLDSRIHELNVTYSLEAANDHTRYQVEAKIRWKFPMNIIRLFMGRKMKSQLAQQLDGETLELKRLCEG